jgi:hypothetical protein
MVVVKDSGGGLESCAPSFPRFPIISLSPLNCSQSSGNSACDRLRGRHLAAAGESTKRERNNQVKDFQQMLTAFHPELSSIGNRSRAYLRV